MNRCDYLDPALAWVGVKDSGRGCTLSVVGYEHLTRPKSFHLRTQSEPEMNDLARQLELPDLDPVRRGPHRRAAGRVQDARHLAAAARHRSRARSVADDRERGRVVPRAGLACEVFCDVQANPVEANVTNGVAAYRRGAHDGVIAFGGGSALDTGKAIALMVGQSRPIWDFEDREDWYTRVNVAGMAPTSAVPTTAGTGSEVGRASVITDPRDHTKKIIFHPRMLPALVIADPELTVGLPPKITAAVGMDALSHNLEAYCAPFHHPLADGIAVEGMRLDQGMAADRRRERRQHRSARAHAGRVSDGRDGVPERARRDAQPEPSRAPRISIRIMG